MNGPKNRRVLVVDDNRAIHEDFRKILETRSTRTKVLADIEASIFDELPVVPTLDGFNIDSALQGQEGLECVQKAKVNQQPYAVAFIDVRMPPGWDGIETTAQIWNVDPDIQVVICTAYSDYSWDEMIQKLGQTDRLVILKKPFDNIEVSQLAQALTRKWELLQQAKEKVINLEAMVRERTTELVRANETLLTEIAERKQLEHDRQMMEVQLRQSQKLEAIGQLAAGIAHEINTPVQYVGDNTRFLKDSFETFTQLLHNYEELVNAAKTNTLNSTVVTEAEKKLVASDLKYLFEQIPAAINETLEGTERISKIVRAMKEFSHPGGKEKVSSDLNKAIESTVTVAHHEWKFVADLKLDLDPGLPAVPCFIGEFNQCILNLVVNAAHAIGDVIKQKPGTKGIITVRTRQDGDHVEIRISDTGTGIPESARPHIFEPFFTTKDVGKGTGQGLSIIYANIVKKHNGTVNFESKVGEGTSFIIRLPIKSDVTEPLPQTHAVPVPSEL